MKFYHKARNRWGFIISVPDPVPFSERGCLLFGQVGLENVTNVEWPSTQPLFTMEVLADQSVIRYPFGGCIGLFQGKGQGMIIDNKWTSMSTL